MIHRMTALGLAACWTIVFSLSAARAGVLGPHPDSSTALVYGDKPRFFCGPGDPEDFLYRGALLPDGTRDGDQDAIIRKLLENGGNTLYIQAVRSHGGDGAPSHNPFLEHDPKQGLNSALLDQWDGWLNTLDQHGILIYFFLYDDSADPWNSGDVVTPQENRLVTEIVSRFRNLRHLIWVVAEESEEALSPQRAASLAQLIHKIDGHQRLIGNHHHSGPAFKSFQPGGPFNHYAMQLNLPPEAVYQGTLDAVGRAHHYQLIYAENTETPQTVDAWRRHAWTVSMAGAMPMLLGMDVATTPEVALRQCRILSEFFEDTPFPTMKPAPEIAGGASRYALANAEGAFTLWSNDVPTGAQFSLHGLPRGNYEILWLDCQSGRRIEAEVAVTSKVTHLEKPASLGSECAVHGRPQPQPQLRSTTYPGAEWERRTPAEAGLDAKALDRFIKLAGGRGVIVRDGYWIRSWGDAGRSSDIASAGKPFYSHLLFRALEEGLLESANDPIARIRPCLNGLNADRGFPDRDLTFRHLAFQTAAFGYREAPGNAYDYNDFTMGFFWDVLVNDVFDIPWSAANQRLFVPELVAPLQFQDPLTFPTEGRQSGRLRVSPRDFARVGVLYLNQGRWRERQLMSPRHARLAVSDPLPLSIPRTLGHEAERCDVRSIGGGGNQADHNGGYSWLWWVNGIARDGERWWRDAPDDMFCALGHCGQRGLAVFPSQGLVVSWNDAQELHCDRELGNAAFGALMDAIVE